MPMFGAVVFTRIIPADAGSTRSRRRILNILGDHPRGCGEHCVVGAVSGSLAGSSPRMRGALADFGTQMAHKGIIPADAGSTQRCIRAQRPCGDHPRGCGEHEDTDAKQFWDEGSSPRMRGAPTAFLTAINGPSGSSPRMRGALLRLAVRHRNVGIIPADAGSTHLCF